MFSGHPLGRLTRTLLICGQQGSAYMYSFPASHVFLLSSLRLSLPSHPLLISPHFLFCAGFAISFLLFFSFTPVSRIQSRFDSASAKQQNLASVFHSSPSALYYLFLQPLRPYFFPVLVYLPLFFVIEFPPLFLVISLAIYYSFGLHLLLRSSISFPRPSLPLSITRFDHCGEV